MTRPRAQSLQIDWHSSILVEHDLFRKPVSTFRDHALAVSSAQKSRGGARLEPESAATRLHQRRQRTAKAFGIAARDGAEAIVAGIALTECEQTKPESDPGSLVAGIDDEETAKKIGGR